MTVSYTTKTVTKSKKNPPNPSTTGATGAAAAPRRRRRIKKTITTIVTTEDDDGIRTSTSTTTTTKTMTMTPSPSPSPSPPPTITPPATTLPTTDTLPTTNTQTSSKRILMKYTKDQKNVIQSIIDMLEQKHKNNDGKRMRRGSFVDAVDSLAKIGITVTTDNLRARLRRQINNRNNDSKENQKNKINKNKNNNKKGKRKIDFSSSDDSDDDSSSDEEENSSSKRRASKKRKSTSPIPVRTFRSLPQTKQREGHGRTLTEEEARLVAQAKNEIAVEAEKRKRLAGRLARGELDDLINNKKKQLGIPDDVEVKKNAVRTRLTKGRKLVCHHLGPVSPLAELEDLFVEETIRMVKTGKVVTPKAGVAMVNGFIIKFGYQEKLIAWKQRHGGSSQEESKMGQISTQYWKNF